MIAQAESELKTSSAPFGIWPENCLSVSVFTALATQWRYGQGGRPIGIDYMALQACMSLMQIDPDEWPVTFSGVQTMEFEVVRFFREKA